MYLVKKDVYATIPRVYAGPDLGAPLICSDEKNCHISIDRTYYGK
jgi:hypothetical protein